MMSKRDILYITRMAVLASLTSCNGCPFELGFPTYTESPPTIRQGTRIEFTAGTGTYGATIVAKNLETGKTARERIDANATQSGCATKLQSAAYQAGLRSESGLVHVNIGPSPRWEVSVTGAYGGCPFTSTEYR